MPVESSGASISQAQYKELMRRVNKVLAPLYRGQEMESEIAQEWLQDSRGQKEITQNVLAKILFRIAHYWCTNIDLDEYIDLLQRIYTRITYKRVYFTETESVKSIYPRIQIAFPLEEKRISETVVRGGAHQQHEDTEWMECASNESMDPEFEYETKTDDVHMKAMRVKRKKQGGKPNIDYGLPS
jgi:hypothetical protein